MPLLKAFTVSGSHFNLHEKKLYKAIQSIGSITVKKKKINQVITD